MEGDQKFPGFSQRAHQGSLARELELLERDGHFLLEGVFAADRMAETRARMDAIWARQLAAYGESLLERVGDYGVSRAMMAEDPFFLEFIVDPAILPFVAATVGETAILHLQNGVVSHPNRPHNQARYHRDFAKDFVSTKLLSVNAFVVVDDFSEETGATWIVPGTHRVAELPSPEYVQRHAVQLCAPAGSMIFFDSMLWHAGGSNRTQATRRSINHQYTRPFLKQQLDYPVIMNGKVDRESKLAQVLGMWSIPPRSVDEYRVHDPALRTYRAGQG